MHLLKLFLDFDFECVTICVSSLKKDFVYIVSKVLKDILRGKKVCEFLALNYSLDQNQGPPAHLKNFKSHLGKLRFLTFEVLLYKLGLHDCNVMQLLAYPF
jgi:hypothetical protein